MKWPRHHYYNDIRDVEEGNRITIKYPGMVDRSVTMYGPVTKEVIIKRLQRFEAKCNFANAKLIDDLFQQENKKWSKQ